MSQQSTHAERSASDELCEKVAREITVGLATALDTGVTDGMLRVFKTASALRHELVEERLALYDDVISLDGETWIGSFGSSCP